MCCSLNTALGIQETRKTQASPIPPQPPAHPTSRSSMVPGWNGGKALPFGGSFGEYSLNDLEEQPAERGRTQFSHRHQQQQYRGTSSLLPGRRRGDGGMRDQHCWGALTCTGAAKPPTAQSHPRCRSDPLVHTVCQFSDRSRCPGGGAAGVPGSGCALPPHPQPFHAAPNPTDLTRESHGIFSLTFLSPWRRVNNHPAGGSPGSHHLPLRQASGHQVRDGRRCRKPVPPLPAAPLAP